MPRSQAIQVSVIVPCRNEIRHIREFLDSVLRQRLGRIEMEVLIADGMSDDGTRQVLGEMQSRCAAIRVLDNPEKIVSTGLNRAIREARGEIIIRMDAHSIYAQDYVDSCVEVLGETNADNVGGPALTCADGYIAQAIAHGFHTPFATGGAKFRDPRYQGPVDTVMYGCWRKSTLERIGLFDENLVRSQDSEWNARLLGSGGTAWQSPKITFWYRPRASLSGLFRQYFQYGYWKVSVMRKHRKSASLRNLVPGTCLLAALLLLLLAASANFGGLVQWRNIFLSSLAALAGSYFAASLLASVRAAKRRGWKFLPVFPIVFATYHLSYGLGFLLAVSYRPAPRGRPSPVRKVLTAMTR